MDGLSIQELPELRSPVLIAAFRGWPDAQQAASRAVRYLVRHLPAQRFASIDPEEYLDFSQVRPITMLLPSGERTIQWPSNEFYYWRGQGAPQDLVLFLGTEPSLKWRTFTNVMIEVAKQCQISTLVTLGAFLDAVPHTREPLVTASGSAADLVRDQKRITFRDSGYQGPTGIHGVLTDAFHREERPWISLWGHAPHYLQGMDNPKVSYALLTRVLQLFDLPVDLERMRAAGGRFEREVTKVLEQRSELTTYVRQLEGRYDASPSAEVEEMPDSQSLVEELERFLHQQQGGGGEPPDR